MTEAAAAVDQGKEADHHPYFRPKDAATLILVDRTNATPKVLVGKRHDKVVFMPGKFVFPGGRVDKSDNRVPVAAPIPKALEDNLMKGSPKITPSRARSLAIAAIREACEETGLCLGRKNDGKAPKLEGAWQAFTQAGLLPDPSGLYLKPAPSPRPAGSVASIPGFSPPMPPPSPIASRAWSMPRPNWSNWYGSISAPSIWPTPIR